eukprot:2471630-Lingulodinium_polyedra.AAC.1
MAHAPLVCEPPRPVVRERRQKWQLFSGILRQKGHAQRNWTPSTSSTIQSVTEANTSRLKLSRTSSTGRC